MTLKYLNQSLLSLKTAGMLALASSLFALVPAHAEDIYRIAYVNTQRISKAAQEAQPYKSELQKIEQDFSKRDKDIRDFDAHLKALSEKFDKDSLTLSDSDRVKRQRELVDMDKELQRKKREFLEDLNQRRNEELSSILDHVTKVIQQIAEAEKYDLVLQEAVYISPRIDITDKVIKALNK